MNSKPGGKAYGCFFKNGKFYALTDHCRTVMSGWPDPKVRIRSVSHKEDGPAMADRYLCAFSVTHGAPVLPVDMTPFFSPSGHGLIPEIFYGEKTMQSLKSFPAAMGQYVDQMPADVWNELLKYRTGRWQLLNLMARCPGAVDLSRSNPPLLFALAHHKEFRKTRVEPSEEIVSELILTKQRKILVWLGFPPTETARRVLAKLRPELLTVPRLKFVRLILNNPELTKSLQLNALTELTGSVLDLLADPRTRSKVTPEFLQDCAEYDIHTRSGTMDNCAYRLVKEMLFYSHYLGLWHWRIKARSINMVIELRDAFLADYNVMYPKDSQGRSIRLFGAPFAGNDHIIPLTTSNALEREGLEQNNCVLAYANLVKRGKQFIYRVESPVRATLSIRKYKNGAEWFPGQLLRAHNKPVDNDIRKQLFAELFRTRRIAKPRPLQASISSADKSTPTLWDWELKGEEKDGREG